jgi:hypothetical protein
MYQTFFEQYLSQGVPLPTAMAAARARALQSAGAQLSEQQLEVINDADCCAWVAQAMTQTKGGRVTARRYS